MIKYSNGDCPSPSRSDGFQKKNLFFFSLDNIPPPPPPPPPRRVVKAPHSPHPLPLLGCGNRRQQGIKNVYRKSPTEFCQFKFSTKFFFKKIAQIPVRLFKLPQWRHCFLARSFAPRSNYTLYRCALPAHFPFYLFIF